MKTVTLENLIFIKYLGKIPTCLSISNLSRSFLKTTCLVEIAQITQVCKTLQKVFKTTCWPNKFSYARYNVKSRVIFWVLPFLITFKYDT